MKKERFLGEKSVAALFVLGKKQAFRGNDKMRVDGKKYETLKKVFS